MTFTCTLTPSGKTFPVDSGETLLAAALRADIVLPYGCKDGACGSCKATLSKGEVDYGQYQTKALSDEERKAGHLLLCQATAQSDLTVAARVVAADGLLPARKLPCRVASIEKAAADVAIVRLQLPATEKFQFLAGQYIDILLKDGKRRSYSMANAPHDHQQIELHIRHSPGGAFTEALFGTGTPSINAVKEKDILRFEGPQGTFFLREDSPKPMVMLASGTGFAPIKAVIEHAVFKGIRRPITLYWGGRRPQDLYLDGLARQWAATIADFHYIPVVSDALPEDQWQGRTGFVHQAVMSDHPDLSGHAVYACGAPIVVQSAQRDFVGQCGLPEDEFFADAFTTAADLAKQAAPAGA
ncbi:MAG: CDP-6-deoxy-delta-3,4-glucoseen reductase [Burkholderiaceae bacterium]|nr:CDP-6-deoxy-delta-3,4-glucoseen reductase [Burkholderiaceae bacterium]